MTMIQTVLHIFFLILFVYLVINTLYFFIITIAGLLYRRPKYGVHEKKKRIAVLIPSYKEDNIIFNTARRAAEHDYTKD
jgi:cellulose synthase/poly-beta-1,6-N-acetylglucosamine synthase-like glycosyltransferase